MKVFFYIITYISTINNRAKARRLPGTDISAGHLGLKEKKKRWSCRWYN